MTAENQVLAAVLMAGMEAGVDGEDRPIEDIVADVMEVDRQTYDLMGEVVDVALTRLAIAMVRVGVSHELVEVSSIEAINWVHETFNDPYIKRNSVDGTE